MAPDTGIATENINEYPNIGLYNGKLYNNNFRSQINSSKIHPIDMKYLIQRSSGRFYLQLHLNLLVKQYSLKTDIHKMALIRRDIILFYVKTNQILSNNDKITMDIISKIIKVRLSMFEDEDLQINYDEEEKYNKIDKVSEMKELLEDRNRLQQLKIEEQQQLQQLIQQQENDIKKIQTEELDVYLTKEEVIERERLKISKSQQQTILIQTPINNGSVLLNIPFKEYWDKYIELKTQKSIANKKTIQKDTFDRMNTSYNYLLDFLDGDENFNVCLLNGRFFKDLQLKYTKIPSRAPMYEEFKDKSMKEVITIKTDRKMITTTYINNLFSYYIEFFKYLDSEFYIYTNDVFKNYEPLIKHESESYKEFTHEELGMLLKNDIPYLYNGFDSKEEAVNFLHILMYSGFRLNELVQMKKTDIYEEDGVLCFHLTEDKQLKNKQSVRIVPIHSKILDLVKRLMNNNKSEYLIYDGKSSNSTGKTVLGYIKKIVDEKGKVIHSLRSNFVQELYSNDVEERLIKKLVGHTGDLKKNVTNYNYNKNKASIEQLKTSIETIKYKGL